MEQLISLPSDRDIVEQYIRGTLMYTPQEYLKEYRIRKKPFLEILAYPPGESKPSMKIFRMMSCLDWTDSVPVGNTEIDFQDEISILPEEGLRSNKRLQVNFSIFVDDKDFVYQSINNKPKDLPHVVLESAKVFEELSKQKGARLWIGHWQFESDGLMWKQKTGDLMLPILSIEGL